MSAPAWAVRAAARCQLDGCPLCIHDLARIFELPLPASYPRRSEAPALSMVEGCGTPDDDFVQSPTQGWRIE